MKKIIKIVMLSVALSSGANAFFPIPFTALSGLATSFTGAVSTAITSVPGVNTALDAIGDISDEIVGVIPGLPSGGANPLNPFESLQWGLFWDEFELNGFRVCSWWPIRAGFIVQTIEPAGLIETTGEEYYSPMFDSSLVSYNPLYQGSTRKTTEDEDSTVGGRDNLVYSHYWKYNVFEFIGLGGGGFFCFDKGTPFISLWFSEWTPGYSKDIVYASFVAPVKTQMILADVALGGFISGLLDCGAAMGVNTINGFTTDIVSDEFAKTKLDLPEFVGGSGAMDEMLGKVESWLNGYRFLSMHTIGCQGYSPIGGYSGGEDPGEDAEVVAFGLIDTMHTIAAWMPFATGLHFNKQSDVSTLPIDTICYPVPYPGIIKPQYLYQRAGLPSVGGAHVIGATSLVSSILSNKPGSQDESATWIWKYRDYATTAYYCPYM